VPVEFIALGAYPNSTFFYTFLKQMTLYDVICPSAPWENETTDTDTAWDVCYSLSNEYGYAEIRCLGYLVGSYTNGE
jgi:hypothetical protein